MGKCVNTHAVETYDNTWSQCTKVSSGRVKMEDNIDTFPHSYTLGVGCFQGNNGFPIDFLCHKEQSVVLLSYVTTFPLRDHWELKTEFRTVLQDQHVYFTG